MPNETIPAIPLLTEKGSGITAKPRLLNHFHWSGSTAGIETLNILWKHLLRFKINCSKSSSSTGYFGNHGRTELESLNMSALKKILLIKEIGSIVRGEFKNAQQYRGGPLRIVSRRSMGQSKLVISYYITSNSPHNYTLPPSQTALSLFSSPHPSPLSADPKLYSLAPSSPHSSHLHWDRKPSYTATSRTRAYSLPSSSSFRSHTSPCGSGTQSSSLHLSYQ